jgi:hypothetical protein
MTEKIKGSQDFFFFFFDVCPPRTGARICVSASFREPKENTTEGYRYIFLS